MVRVAILGAAAALILMTGTAAAKRIDVDASKGPSPIASAEGWLRQPSRGPRVEVETSGRAPIVLQFNVQCWNEGKRHARKWNLEPGPAPFSQRISLPISRPDECFVAVEVEYAEIEQKGRIAASIFK